MDIDVVVRTGEELRRLVDRPPLRGRRPGPRRDRVLRPPGEHGGGGTRLAKLAVEGERVQVDGADIFADFPGGQARSKLGDTARSPH